MPYNLIFNLLIVHIICDFYLQNKSLCTNKITHSIKGHALWLHACIIGILSFIVVWNIYAWWLAILICCSHLVIDWLKSFLQLKFDIYRVTENDGNLTNGLNCRYNLYLFIGDQFLHFTTIIVIAHFWYKINSNWEQFQWLQTLIHNHPIRVYTVIAILLALKPINILILQILKSCKLDNALDSRQNSEENEYFHAGALIGYTERILILMFVILSQYEAIGFLIAAKSILRFNEASSGNIKSEYVLSGTLLSLIFSLFLGLCVNKAPII